MDGGVTDGAVYDKTCNRTTETVVDMARKPPHFVLATSLATTRNMSVVAIQKRPGIQTLLYR